jgi:hypothetical protein
MHLCMCVCAEWVECICHYCYAECLILNVIMMIVIVLSVVILNVIIMIAIVLSAVLLNGILIGVVMLYVILLCDVWLRSFPPYLTRRNSKVQCIFINLTLYQTTVHRYDYSPKEETWHFLECLMLVALAISHLLMPAALTLLDYKYAC